MLTPQLAWLVIGLIAAGMVIACLQVLGNQFYRHVRRHDFKMEVHTLRNAYLDRLAEAQAAESVDEDGDGEQKPEPISPVDTLLRDETKLAA